MRVLVTGADGALGEAVVAELIARGHSPVASTRRDCDISNYFAVASFLDGHTVDLVINCAGIIPERGLPSASMISVNAFGPTLLGLICFEREIGVINVSTDCVFRPDRPNAKRVDDLPDAVDVYGRSKALGEYGDGVCNVRTSFVTPRNGLWNWLVESAESGTESLPGYQRAWWSGSTVWAVAKRLVDLGETEELPRIVHLSTRTPISKFDALHAIRKRLWLKIGIDGVENPVIHRVLVPTMELEPLASALEWAPIGER